MAMSVTMSMSVSVTMSVSRSVTSMMTMSAVMSAIEQHRDDQKEQRSTRQVEEKHWIHVCPSSLAVNHAANLKPCNSTSRNNSLSNISYRSEVAS
jgi:hypothetical protein